MGHRSLWALVALAGFACGDTSSPAAMNGGSSGAGGASSGTAGNAGTLGTTGGSGSTDASVVEMPETGQPTPPDASDAKPVDASAADTGDEPSASDAASLPCPAGALLCEDFDEYASATDLAASWKVTATAATMTVDATKPFHATGKSLHIVAPAGTPNAVIVKEGAPLFPIAGNVMYGRVMVWLTQTPAGNYHWNNFQSAGIIPTSMRYGKYGWGGQNGKVLAGYTVRLDPSDAALVDCSNPSASAMPEKKWACLEWKFDGVANEMHYWFDGVLLADVDVVGKGTRCVNQGDLGSTWLAPTFANLTVGWQQYQASTGALELWMDDLVMSTQRIGCPAP